MKWPLLWPALVLAGACGKSPAPPEPPRETVWLQDVYLLTTQNGRNVSFVAGPRLATVTADGQVESQGATLGYIDARAPVAPGHGMILYATRTTALVDLQRRERVWGRLHAGARVAVRPLIDGYEVAPGPPFGNRRFFVIRDDLSATPLPNSAAPPTGVFCGSVQWRPNEGDVAWTDPCLPVQLGPEPGRLRQQLLGVELDGQIVDGDRARCTPGSSYAARACVAEAVVESDHGLRWMPAPLAVARPVDGLPAGHLAIEKSNRLGRHLEKSDGVFVMRWDGGTAACTSLAKEPARKDALSPKYSLRTNAASSGVWAEMELGHLETEMAYLEVGGSETHVDLLVPQLQDGALSYVASDVERWFFTKEACQSVVERHFRLHQDPAF